MRLYDCTVCHTLFLWGPHSGHFSSLFIDDECPRRAVFVCSDACQKTATTFIDSGAWRLHIVKPRGYQATVKEQAGYAMQPTQEKLLAQWNEQLEAIKNPS